MLSELNYDKINDEKKIQEELFSTCDNFTSTIFDAGAGSGKTYALVECIKYIINKNHKNLSVHNQKIACITYTNVAANNVKQRIGNSSVLEVSTIHDRIWDIIKNQKYILIKLHKEKLEKEIQKIEKELISLEVYNSLQENEKEQFFNIMNKNKELFFNYYKLSSNEFRNNIKQIEGFPIYSNLLKNVNHFKKIVSCLFKINDYKECLLKINNKEYKDVFYDAKYNNDKLDEMRISHDTVLEYGKLAIKNNPLLRQIIIDKYPFILIDEYQDTSPNVIEIMYDLDSYSKEIKHNFYVAYFGDYAQNIYDTGIGQNIEKIHQGINKIIKPYNRRSCGEIINVINNIRNDEKPTQTSIYNDNLQGHINFYHGLALDNFLQTCKNKLNISKDNKLHCLVPRNKDIATLCNFEELYNIFYESDYYKTGTNFNLLNQELLSNDISKLGEIQLILYKTLKLINDVKNKSNSINCIDTLSRHPYFSLIDLRKLLEIFQSLTWNNLDELFSKLVSIYDTGNENIKHIITELFDINDLSLEKIKQKIIDKLFFENIEKINSFLAINFEQTQNWYKFITEENNGEIIYHTIHGSKGEEYNNVAVIIGDNFRKKDNFFRNFFDKYNKNESDEKYIAARNLIYVACSRAIYNLYILYTDDIDGIEQPIKEIFGELTK